MTLIFRHYTNILLIETLKRVIKLVLGADTY
jgi:hypothetical protein